ncbi:MAG TPA: 2-oxo-4-hydroxy-4-carboxy-5-ureidoimidazoline decarboxylase [Gaiellaceae bacterium]|jgi:2-oxo-4-hydroxy-4-carboxy--5-ureidoimidazoline (OHCU) decarboxylase
MRDLPRQLNVEELDALFEGHSQLTEELARREDPLGQARAVLEELPEEARVEALNTHPRIGERGGSARSAEEQGSDEDPALLAALRHLNKSYEEKFGFRFVVFVNGRPRGEILSVMRERFQHAREEELGTGLDELVAIALDRWQSR